MERHRDRHSESCKSSAAGDAMLHQPGILPVPPVGLHHRRLHPTNLKKGTSAAYTNSQIFPDPEPTAFPLPHSCIGREELGKRGYGMRMRGVDEDGERIGEVNRSTIKPSPAILAVSERITTIGIQISEYAIKSQIHKEHGGPPLLWEIDMNIPEDRGVLRTCKI